MLGYAVGIVRSSPHPSLSRWLVAVAALAATAGLGCISTPLEERNWQALQTPHFEILTTYNTRDAEQLAKQLEQFRLAAEHTWGSAIPARSRRIRVIAYDGNGVERPFRVLDRETSYLVALPGRDTLVLRTRLGWGEDAPIELRLDLARRLFRNASSEDLPPWLVEGLAQLASTSQVKGEKRVRAMEMVPPLLFFTLLDDLNDQSDRVHAGLPHQGHIEHLRRNHWIPLGRVLTAPHLEGWSRNERRLFDAESWALAHYMKYGRERGELEDDPLSTLRRQLSRGDTAEVAARKALGPNVERELPRYVNSERFESAVLAVRPGPSPEGWRPVVPAELLDALGELSLHLDRYDQARSFFEHSLSVDPKRELGRAGLAWAQALAGSARGAEEAERTCAALLRADAPDAELLLRIAHTRRALAERSDDATERRRHARAAAEVYQRVLSGNPADQAAARYGLAAAQFAAGDGEAADQSLEQARRWLSGDPAQQRLSARVAFALGDAEEARRWARRALTTARSDSELEAANRLLSEIDSPLARF